MPLKSFAAKLFAKITTQKVQNWADNPIETQEKIFSQLISGAQNTAFGKDHHFEQIHSYEDFKKAVPVRDYEGFKAYIERIKQGQENVLWKGKPIYFAKTSGTTSGTKYIPISKESMPYHIQAAQMQ